MSRPILRKSGGRDKAVLPVNSGPVEPLGLGPPSDLDTPSPPPFGPITPTPPGPPIPYGAPGPYGPPRPTGHPVPLDRTFERMQREMERMQREMEYQMRTGMALPPPPHSLAPAMPLCPRPEAYEHPGVSEDGARAHWEHQQPSPNAMVTWPTTPEAVHTDTPAEWVAPIIRNTDNGHRAMELTLDVTGFGPDDIHINTDGHVLEIQARQLRLRRDSKGVAYGTSRVANEFKKQFTLPEPVRAENLRCLVSTDGRLVIEGPLGAQVIPHKHRRKVKFALTR